jgi:hypothetical protein
MRSDSILSRPTFATQRKEDYVSAYSNTTRIISNPFGHDVIGFWQSLFVSKKIDHPENSATSDTDLENKSKSSLYLSLNWNKLCRSVEPFTNFQAVCLVLFK